MNGLPVFVTAVKIVKFAATHIGSSPVSRAIYLAKQE